ncbi:MAG TPA: Gfo/Idh/MocA family oxidoreductase [Polyangia bacterium]|jgi:predicted dehydrogenase
MKTPLRGALIGYGFIMEKGHGAAYRQRMQGTWRGQNSGDVSDASDVRIVAVADISEARRRLAVEHLPGVRVYADHVAMLDAEAGNLDFVDIATPPAEHAAVTREALSRGLHVLCEKPLATSIADAREMLDLARRAGRVIYPCHNYKHAPVIQNVRRVIDAGEIGRVHLVTLQTFRNTHARGVSEWRPNWRRERRHSGGGIAMDHGSHTFYLAFEWLRSYPTAISARMSTMGNFDTEDDLSCSLRFPTGVASAHLSWQAGVRKVIYTIHGDRGAIRVEDDNIEVARGGRGNNINSPEMAWKFERLDVPSDWMDSSHVTWFNSLFDDFERAIADGEWVGKEAEEAFLCVELIQTAYASAKDASRELPLGGRQEAEALPELRKLRKRA